jgi:hypothetical protein
VPRARLDTPDGKKTEWKSKALRAYQRRTLVADALIAGAYRAGTNTRRVRRALASLFGAILRRWALATPCLGERASRGQGACSRATHALLESCGLPTPNTSAGRKPKRIKGELAQPMWPVRAERSMLGRRK